MQVNRAQLRGHHAAPVSLVAGALSSLPRGTASRSAAMLRRAAGVALLPGNAGAG
jgi:hypothetical protein